MSDQHCIFFGDKKLPSHFFSKKKIGKVIARESRMKVATECSEDTSLRQYILRWLGRRVRTEFTQLQSLAVNSVIRQQSKESLVEFKWSSIIKFIK